jgi:hypothetical protein
MNARPVHALDDLTRRQPRFKQSGRARLPEESQDFRHLLGGLPRSGLRPGIDDHCFLK